MLVNLMRTVNEIWTSSLEIDKNVSYIFDLFIYLFVCIYISLWIFLHQWIPSLRNDLSRDNISRY